jgi:hypothetical protein
MLWLSIVLIRRESVLVLLAIHGVENAAQSMPSQGAAAMSVLWECVLSLIEQ